MYPGVACTKVIPVCKTEPVLFKENEEKSPVRQHTVPAANIGESDNNYVISMAIPGLSREEFKIDIEDSLISISALKEDKLSVYKIDRCEYNFAHWTRVFQLPADADPILANAEYINGELIIHIPKGDAIEQIAKTSIYVY